MLGMLDLMAWGEVKVELIVVDISYVPRSARQ